MAHQRITKQNKDGSRIPDQLTFSRMQKSRAGLKHWQAANQWLQKSGLRFLRLSKHLKQ